MTCSPWLQGLHFKSPDVAPGSNFQGPQHEFRCRPCEWGRRHNCCDTYSSAKVSADYDSRGARRTSVPRLPVRFHTSMVSTPQQLGWTPRTPRSRFRPPERSSMQCRMHSSPAHRLRSPPAHQLPPAPSHPPASQHHATKHPAALCSPMCEGVQGASLSPQHHQCTCHMRNRHRGDTTDRFMTQFTRATSRFLLRSNPLKISRPGGVGVSPT